LRTAAEGQLEIVERQLRRARERRRQPAADRIEMDVADQLHVHALSRRRDQEL